MMGISDGKFCSTRSEGCAMVQIGAYLAEPPAYGTRPYVLPPNREDCINFFRKECSDGKSIRNVYVCLNLATPKLEWGLEAAKYFYEAKGDLVELNLHGSYEPYLRVGKIRAMVLPENWKELFKWLKAFSKLDIPVIVKFREGVIPSYEPILDEIAKLDLFGIHFNVRNEEMRKPDSRFVEKIKRYPIFLLVSGYVRSAKDVKKLFEAGADMIGIAEPTIQNPKFIAKISKEYFK
jgi:tRNA-dihydrouridine synthase